MMIPDSPHACCHEHEHGHCSHAHAHEHEHNHVHEHEHEHEHEHHAARILSVKGGTMKLCAQKHEQASVCSAVCEWSCPDPMQQEEELSSAMKSVAAWVTDSGGLIGHIKAAMRISESKCFSITLDELTVLPCQTAVTIELAMIVFGITPEALEHKIIQVFGAEG